MPILNPDHLLEQAELLIQPRNPGRPRQADLRRAISSAYYAIFHALITMSADELVGVVHRGTREHGLAMRSVDHKTIKLICTELLKPAPPQSYRPYIPAAGFGPEVGAVLASFPDLQDERHLADYDSLRTYVTSDAKTVIATATQILRRLRAAPVNERKALSYLLLFPPKR